MMMAALDAMDQGGATSNLSPRAISSLWVALGMRASTDMAPGIMVWGNGEAGEAVRGPSWSFDGLLYVHAEIDHVDQCLQGDHHLIVAQGFQ